MAGINVNLNIPITKKARRKAELEELKTEAEAAYYKFLTKNLTGMDNVSEDVPSMPGIMPQVQQPGISQPPGVIPPSPIVPGLRGGIPPTSYQYKSNMLEQTPSSKIEQGLFEKRAESKIQTQKELASEQGKFAQGMGRDYGRAVAAIDTSFDTVLQFGDEQYKKWGLRNG